MNKQVELPKPYCNLSLKPFNINTTGFCNVKLFDDLVLELFPKFAVINDEYVCNHMPCHRKEDIMCHSLVSRGNSISISFCPELETLRYLNVSIIMSPE